MNLVEETWDEMSLASEDDELPSHLDSFSSPMQLSDWRWASDALSIGESPATASGSDASPRLAGD